MNSLWDETIEVLMRHGKTFDDVIAIAGNDFRVSKDNFEEVAKTAFYDSGYGSAEVAVDLKLIGSDFWLERREYDGSEWWAFCQMPRTPHSQPMREINALVPNQYHGRNLMFWPSLKDLNCEED